MEHQAFAQLLGNYGEFFGAIAVAITLVFLTVQMRREVKLTSTEAYRSVLLHVAEHNNVMWSEANAELMIKGLQSFNGLTPAEKGRFDNLMVNLFNDFESYIVTQGQGILDETLMEHWSWYFQTHFLVYPGIQEWWSSSRPLFPEAIAAWVDQEIVDGRSAAPYYGDVSMH